MHPFTRRRAIVEHVNEHGLVSLHDLADLVGASEATIRRDLRDLDAQGLVTRHRGGATRRTPTTPSATPSATSRTDPAAGALAALAATLPSPGDAVAVAAGTAARPLATALGQIPGLTVVTNSLVVAVELAPTDTDVIVTGGTPDPGGYALVGTAAEASLHGIRVRYAFVPADGLTAAHGLTSRSLPLASVTRALALVAQDTVALAPRAAVGRDSVVEAVPTAALTHVVTDAPHDDPTLAALADAGVVVRTVRGGTRPAAATDEPALSRAS
jgi:DeoR/GlpR family transcriptional regulator of sugar metabolism